MSKEKLGLYQKIFAVYQDIEYLQKDDKVSFGQTSYKAISEEKVTMAVRDSLIKNRLIVLPIEQDHKKEGNLSTVDTKYKIIDIDTGESEVIVSSGTGADTQDKGVGKAMTYAYKYLFLRTFAIPTGEDPDKVSSAELDAKQNSKPAENSKPQSNNNGKPASEATLNTVTKIINELAKARGAEPTLVYTKLKEAVGTKIEQEHWSQNLASKAIGVLNEWKKKQGAA